MTDLMDRACPRCHRPMALQAARRKPSKPVSYWDCVRYCGACGVAFSNAQDKPVLIYRDPVRAVPEPVRNGLMDTLGQALNRRNLHKKLDAFCSENSEDAVTWTVFRYLQTSGLLPSALRGLGIEPGDIAPTMLLWGAPVSLDSPSGCALRRRLMDVEDQIGEKPSARTEPDVLLEFGDGRLAVIEVKLNSGPTIRKPDYAHWQTYLPAQCFADSKEAMESGLYELVRNWRIGCELADGRPFHLLSLGPAGLYAGDALSARLATFQEGLATHAECIFRHVDWAQLLSPVLAQCDSWFINWLRCRGLDLPHDQEGDTMTQADQIRHYALTRCVEPARRARAETTTFCALDIAKGLGLNSRYPNICQAIDGSLFAELAGVKLLRRHGPKQSSSVTWTFEV